VLPQISLKTHSIFEAPHVTFIVFWPEFLLQGFKLHGQLLGGQEVFYFDDFPHQHHKYVTEGTKFSFSVVILSYKQSALLMLPFSQ
jgi:hypothetical protein